MPYDGAVSFQNSVSATLTTGPLNDLGVPTLTGYKSGATNRLLLTPATGGSTINGIDASGCSDGYTIMIVNQSTTDNLTFAHNGGGISTNQFSNTQAQSVALLPLGAARCTYVISRWRFA
jgi:hypothetical protein